MLRIISIKCGIHKKPPAVNLSEIMWSWTGAFLGIATVGLISYKVLEGKGLTMIIGSFGASAVLIYGAIKSRWRSRGTFWAGIFSPLLSAWPPISSLTLIYGLLRNGGCHCYSIHAYNKDTASPGGATALIAVIGGESVHKLGYLYAIIPTAVGPQ